MQIRTFIQVNNSPLLGIKLVRQLIMSFDLSVRNGLTQKSNPSPKPTNFPIGKNTRCQGSESNAFVLFPLSLIMRSHDRFILKCPMGHFEPIMPSSKLTIWTIFCQSFWFIKVLLRSSRFHCRLFNLTFSKKYFGRFWEQRMSRKYFLGRKQS